MRKVLNFVIPFVVVAFVACGGGSDSTAPGSGGSGGGGGGSGCTSSTTQGCVDAAGTSFSPASVTINANGQVTWTFGSGGPHNVTFSGSAPSGGNIGNTSSGTVSRTFATAGTYSYSCTNHSGMNGSVVVQ